jgi:hypothetical protein
MGEEQDYKNSKNNLREGKEWVRMSLRITT